MLGDYEKDLESGTERRRSRSGVPDSEAPREPPRPGRDDTEGPAGGPVSPSPSPHAGDLGGAEKFPEARSEYADENAPIASRPVMTRRQFLKKRAEPRESLSPQKKLLLLDCWRRSGLPARDFGAITGVPRQSLYAWQRRFKLEGPAGLVDKPRGVPAGSRLSDLTQRTILMLKESNPEWGCERISDMLLRGPGLGASAGAVARVLHEAGYISEELPTHPHPDKPREFERAKPNQLWQTDLFTFILKRQNRRVYLVAFLDDHSRFIVSYGLHATQSAQLVIEVLRSAIASYQTPEEILTDNGAQYVTWRGKSAFSKDLEKRGIRQIVARPRHPQTLGKIERFWGTLWRECIESAVFLDLLDAQRRIGLFIDHYNFQRPHQGIDGLAPADRFFGAAEDVLRTLKARVAANALDLARNGLPKAPFYLTGNAGGKTFSVHAEGERVILRRDAGEREEIELVGPKPKEELPQSESAALTPASEETSLPFPLCPSASPSDGILEEEHEEIPLPGQSPLDEALRRIAEGFVPKDKKDGEVKE